MKITFDPAKRDTTFEERGLDFAAAAAVFLGRQFTVEDDRADYGETRFVTVGYLGGRMVMVVWTPREGARRVISMRWINGKERRRYQAKMG